MSLVAPWLFLLAALAQDPETERTKKEIEKLKADQEVLLRQLEVSLAQIQELQERLAKTLNEKSLAKDQAGRLGNDLRALEENQVEMARSKKALEDQLKTMERVVIPVRAKVTAVANEIALIVLSIGADDGVLNGMEFTVYRGGDFVAKVVVDRVDRKWSAAKITLKKRDPQVGDEVSNAIFVTASAPAKANEHYRLAEELLRKGDRSGAKTESQRAVEVDPNNLAARTLLSQLSAGAAVSPKAGAELQALRKELDEVRSQVRQLSDRLMPSWQGFGIAVEPASEELLAHLGISRGLLVRRVRGASIAEKQGLQANDVIPDLEEKQALEILESDKLLEIVRRGQRMNIPGVKRR